MGRSSGRRKPAPRMRLQRPGGRLLGTGPRAATWSAQPHGSPGGPAAARRHRRIPWPSRPEVPSTPRRVADELGFSARSGRCPGTHGVQCLRCRRTAGALRARGPACTGSAYADAKRHGAPRGRGRHRAGRSQGAPGSVPSSSRMRTSTTTGPQEARRVDIRIWYDSLAAQEPTRPHGPPAPGIPRTGVGAPGRSSVSAASRDRCSFCR